MADLSWVVLGAEWPRDMKESLMDWPMDCSEWSVFVLADMISISWSLCLATSKWMSSFYLPKRKVTDCEGRIKDR